jgi:hypothetical protein
MHGSTCWREWLGTIRTEEVKASNLFLLGKMRAAAAPRMTAAHFSANST